MEVVSTSVLVSSETEKQQQLLIRDFIVKKMM